MIILPDGVAAEFRAEIRQQIASRSYQIRLLGFLVAGDPASEAYAEYTRSGCQDVGIEFEVRKIKASDVEQAIRHANNDNSIHGIFVYYPIYRDERDSQLKDLISHKKDVEGLGSYWMKKLYENVRFDDDAKTRKAILPCTPLAILKLLEREISPLNGTRSFEGRRITIFNRSEVVGRPLAYMLKNDGATVFSFDVDGGWALECPATGRCRAGQSAPGIRDRHYGGALHAFPENPGFRAESGRHLPQFFLYPKF